MRGPECGINATARLDFCRAQTVEDGLDVEVGPSASLENFIMLIWDGDLKGKSSEQIPI